MRGDPKALRARLAEKSDRVRFKGQRDGGCIERFCGGADLTENIAMSEVNTIEVSDGHNGFRGDAGDIVQDGKVVGCHVQNSDLGTGGGNSVDGV